MNKYIEALDRMVNDLKCPMTVQGMNHQEDDYRLLRAFIEQHCLPIKKPVPPQSTLLRESEEPKPRVYDPYLEGIMNR